MKFDLGRATQLLKTGSGRADAVFRDGQAEAIEHVVQGSGRLLVVQKTGWGKSFVYFIATKLLREQGLGPALLISPLLSLMRNQIAAAKRMGVRAATINSDNTDDWSSVIASIARGEVDILLISPERLANEDFNSNVLAKISATVSMLVIDEAHCISDWGHDFRPHYRLLERIVKGLPRNLRLLATTATANNRVMDDLKQVLGPSLTVSRGDLNRPSLSLQTLRMPSQAERLAWLAEHVASLPGHGIIYTLTIRDALMVTQWLQSRGIVVESYTGKTGDGREALEQALLNNDVKALVATTALGMGFDKPDLAFVIHYQMPGSVVAYYQQVGRAGRALDAAYGVLLSGTEESEIADYFIESAFPTQAEVEAILEALEASPHGLSVPEMLGRLNINGGRVKKSILLLSLESPSPIAKVKSKWQLTTAKLKPEFWERAKRLTDLRRGEQSQMQKYVRLAEGHMGFLIEALDGDASGVQKPNLPPISAEVDPALAQAAVDFLRRTSLPIEPRKKWPVGGMAQFGISGASKIPPNLQAQPGKVLCVWGDAGWGKLVGSGKYRDGVFSDELVRACVKLMGEWEPAPDPFPTWVTAVPSLRHPTLVPDFARRLANALGLPFHMVLEKTDARPEQKTMANSIMQARNIDGSLGLVAGRIPDGPVLLVDDMVDSKWTITVASFLLRKHGSGPVWPLALAQTGHETDESESL
jgi:ATP-dependent DNA helicase RecQ